jgi:RHS repeat-associated protein
VPVRFRGLLDIGPTADPDVAGSGSDPSYLMGDRVYSPHLGSFTALDSYAGDTQNPLSMNRFLYALANPATLIDPDGHAVCEFDPCEDHPVPVSPYVPPPPPPTPSNNSGNNGGGQSGTTPTTSGGNQRAGGGIPPIHRAPQPPNGLHRLPCNPRYLTCTIDEMNELSPSERLAWLMAFQAIYGTDDWFDALEDFIKLATHRGYMDKNHFVGQVDANVLTAIQDGLALHLRQIKGSSVGGAAAFGAFFDALRAPQRPDNDTLTRLNIVAEQAAVNAGAKRATATPSFEERFLRGGADAWRSVGRVLIDSDVADHYGVGNVADGIFTPRSHAAPAVVSHYQALLPIFGYVVAAGDVSNCVGQMPGLMAPLAVGVCAALAGAQ